MQSRSFYGDDLLQKLVIIIKWPWERPFLFLYRIMFDIHDNIAVWDNFKLFTILNFFILSISKSSNGTFLDFTWHCSTAAAGLVTLDFISNTAFYAVKWVFSPQLHFPHSSIFPTAPFSSQLWGNDFWAEGKGFLSRMEMQIWSDTLTYAILNKNRRFESWKSFCQSWGLNPRSPSPKLGTLPTELLRQLLFGWENW